MSVFAAGFISPRQGRKGRLLLLTDENRLYQTPDSQRRQVMNSFWTLSACEVMRSLLTVTNPANAFSVTSFSPADFWEDSGDILEYVIEDFGDTNLVSGLRIEWNNPQIGPYTTLQSAISNADFWLTRNNSWDGEKLMKNNKRVYSITLAKPVLVIVQPIQRL